MIFHSISEAPNSNFLMAREKSALPQNIGINVQHFTGYEVRNIKMPLKRIDHHQKISQLLCYSLLFFPSHISNNYNKSKLIKI